MIDEMRGREGEGIDMIANVVRAADSSIQPQKKRAPMKAPVCFQPKRPDQRMISTC